MMNFEDIRIVNLTKVDFINDKGEEVNLCKIVYSKTEETTEKYCGERILEQYVKQINFDKLKQYAGKIVKAYYGNKIDYNTKKEVRFIKKINEIEL